MEINEMSERAHRNSTSKGFYELPNGILARMEKDGYTKEAIKAVKDAFICQRLMLITSELSEALEANRKGRIAPNLAGMDLDQAHGVPFEKAFENNHVKDSFPDELADATIRIGDLAKWLDIDLDTHVRLKQFYNSKREVMHGGKAY
jgi:NTP pyrophosphatase (non-canonical NTP hydrolase)